MIGTPRKAVLWRRRSAAVLGALALVLGGGTLLSGPVAAATSTFQVHCIPPGISGIPPFDGPTVADISVSDTTPQVGDTVTVTYVLDGPMANTSSFNLPIPEDQITPTVKVKLGGAQTQELTLVGPKDNPVIPAGAQFPNFTITGTFTVTAPGQITLTPGDYNVHSDYGISADTPCTVNIPPAPVAETINVTAPNGRHIALGSTSGPIGADVMVTGTGFTAGATVTVAGVQGAAATGEFTSVAADGSGAFSATLAVSDLDTTGIVAFEGGGYDPATAAGPVPYTVIDTTPPPPGSQKLTTSVKAGTLSMTQAGDTVEMAPVDFGEGGPSTGALRTVTVKDFRGGSTGWSLTGKVTDFKGPGGALIGADRLSWQPVCVAASGSPSTCAAGSAGTVGSTGATLASAPDATFTGGEFAVDAGLSLDVPAYSATGSYSGVLTLTLT
ncbi:beta-xylosidase [Actinacidiphila glaucinigra]|uniref:beta-xylosidase n=1 Tax=Actinacidiphila glaucinigra TaxID=235986 RepID=UPI0035D665D4